MRPTSATLDSDPRAGRETSLERLALVSGILSSLLYVAVDLLATSRWPEYRYAHQTVSELSALGAPTRQLWVAIMLPYNLLLVAFGLGVWSAARGRRPLQATGCLLVALAVTGSVWLFCPMHLRGVTPTLTDTLHIALAVVTGLLAFPAMVLAGIALGRAFRLYSLTTIAVLLAAGAWAGEIAPGIPEGRPTPWIGIIERVNVYGYLLWVLMLGVVLLKSTYAGARSRALDPAHG